MVSRQRKWQQRQLMDGRCRICGKKRGKGSTSIRCAACRQKINALARARYYAEQSQPRKRTA